MILEIMELVSTARSTHNSGKSDSILITKLSAYSTITMPDESDHMTSNIPTKENAVMQVKLR